MKTKTITKTAVTPVTIITQSALVEKLVDKKTATFARLTSDVEVKMNKGGRECSNTLFGKIRKVSTTNVIMGFTYETVINNARVKQSVQSIMDNIEDDKVLAKLLEDFTKSDIQNVAKSETDAFVAEKHGFATPVNKNSKYILAYTKDEEQDLNRLYLKVIVLHSTVDRVYNVETGQDLTELEKEIVKQYSPKKGQEGARQGLDNPRIYRNYMLNSVIGIKFGNDNNYKVIKDAVKGEVVTPVSAQTE